MTFMLKDAFHDIWKLKNFLYGKCQNGHIYFLTMKLSVKFKRRIYNWLNQFYFVKNESEQKTERIFVVEKMFWCFLKRHTFRRHSMDSMLAIVNIRWNFLNSQQFVKSFGFKKNPNFIGGYDTFTYSLYIPHFKCIFLTTFWRKFVFKLDENKNFLLHFSA